MLPPNPLYRGQGNARFSTADARTGAKRGQTVPYDVNGAPTGASGAAADISFSPAGNISATDVQAALQELDVEKLAAALYTAADVLTKLLTVDGSASGLDADLLDGQHGSYYQSRANHTGTQLAATISDFATAVGLLNALTATTLQTSRNFSIGGGGITAATVGFNGSAAVALNASVDAGHVTLARMANLAANSFIGNNTGSAATPIALTVAQAKTLLAITASDVSGLGTASAANTGTSGHVLAFADGANTWSGTQTFTYSIIASGASGAAQINDRSTGATDAWIWYASGGTLKMFQQNGLADRVTFSTNGLTVAGVVKVQTFTVGTLPSAATVGAGSIAYVTDANATTQNSVVASGGSNKVLVHSDGSNWRIS